jgi:hypothetical protein
MRPVIVLFALTLAMAIGGCSKPTAPAVETLSASEDSEPVVNMPFEVKWPGRPALSRQAQATQAGEQVNYTATYSQGGPEGVVIFLVSVAEYPEKLLQGTSPRELLAAHVFALQKDELSRKEIEHGPRKYPGLEIATRSGRHLGRRLVIFAGRRLYEVSVSTTSGELLQSPEVTAFFDSFAVKD